MQGFTFCVSWMVLCSLSCALLAQPTFELSYRSEGAAPLLGNVVLESREDHAEWPDIEVYLEQVWQEKGVDAPAILGTQFDTSGLRVFQPLLPFQPGTTYLAKANGAAPYTFEVPHLADATPPELIAIYPSVKEIPANQLKVYLVFDRPMRRGNVYQHLQLENADGLAEMPFLPLQPELWDSSRQRLTLWFDPGRVKRDLILNQTQGAPLQAGQSYTLHINEAWRDSRGIPLAQNYTHTFRVGPPDRTSPDPDSWVIIPAQAGTHDTLRVEFGESLDFALASSALRLMNEQGQKLNGQIHLSDDQSVWHFVPDDAWQAGAYQIRIDAKLEDLAGNNLNRLFDTDLQQAKTTPEQAFYWLSFYIRAE